jgi:hypothetical protein
MLHLSDWKHFHGTYLVILCGIHFIHWELEMCLLRLHYRNHHFKNNVCFLTVHDLVDSVTGRGGLAQGEGFLKCRDRNTISDTLTAEKGFKYRCLETLFFCL